MRIIEELLKEALKVRRRKLKLYPLGIPIGCRTFVIPKQKGYISSRRRKVGAILTEKLKIPASDIRTEEQKIDFLTNHDEARIFVHFQVADGMLTICVYARPVNS